MRGVNMNQDHVMLVGSIVTLAGMATIWSLKRSKLQGAKYWTVAPGRPHPCVNLLLPVLICGVAFAQAPPASADYTAALPSVEKVKAQLKGTDATDTVARQVAVFTYLQTYISRIKDARKYGGPFTPGEQKLMGDYSLAAYQFSQEFSKTHSRKRSKLSSSSKAGTRLTTPWGGSSSFRASRQPTRTAAAKPPSPRAIKSTKTGSSSR